MKFLSVLLLALPVACAPAAPAPPRSPIERGPLCGAVTTNSAVIKAKLATNGATARLVFSRSAELTDPLYSAADTAATNRGKVVAFTLDQLAPDTAYHYALEIDGKIVPEKHGEFRTFPMGPASFSFAFGSCSLTGSTNKVFDVIRENRPLFYMNDGDWHYEDIRDNVRSRFRAAYDKVLASPPQAKLYRHVPFVYMWDDHDFTGDNSDTSTKAHEATRLTYQEYIPHYPLAAGQGDVPIYQTFTVGRAKFILTDLRSARDKSNKKDDDKNPCSGPRRRSGSSSNCSRPTENIRSSSGSPPSPGSAIRDQTITVRPPISSATCTTRTCPPGRPPSPPSRARPTSPGPRVLPARRRGSLGVLLHRAARVG